MNNDYIQPLITTGGGLVALAVSLLLILFGIFWLTRIVKVDI
jgi:Flp pilus assembly protein TadB